MCSRCFMNSKDEVALLHNGLASRRREVGGKRDGSTVSGVTTAVALLLRCQYSTLMMAWGLSGTFMICVIGRRTKIADMQSTTGAFLSRDYEGTRCMCLRAWCIFLISVCNSWTPERRSLRQAQVGSFKGRRYSADGSS